MMIPASDLNAMDVYNPANPTPFWDRKITLIAISKTGKWLATKCVTGKKAMIANADKSDTFCFAWTGGYSTNIFSITIKELQNIVKDLENGKG